MIGFFEIARTRCGRPVFCFLDRHGRPVFRMEKPGATAEIGSLGGYYNLGAMLKAKGLSI